MKLINHMQTNKQSYALKYGSEEKGSSLCKKILCYDLCLCLTYQTCKGKNLIISCFISCYVYDKHKMNLAVLIFLKTYVRKHESKHER